MAGTKLLYLSDSYLKFSEAKITSIVEKGDQSVITLNQTIFYPQGGGQPSDKGTITGINGSLKVNHVVYNNGKPQHYGKLTGTLSPKDKVTLELDWDNRYLNMQTHTAGHILDEAMKTVLPEHVGIDGCHGIGKQQFVAFTGFIDSTHQSNIQETINQIITNNESITSRMVTKEVIETENIFIPFKLPENKPLRLIKFGDRPEAPDGGTQLSNTSESWPITLTKFTYDKDTTSIHYELLKPSKTVSIPTANHSQSETHLPAKQGSLHSGSVSSLEDFRNKLDRIKSDFSSDTLDQSSQTKYLGKNGLINQLAKDIPQLIQADRKAAGQLLNQLKKEIESSIHLNQPTKNTTEFLDVTAPADMPPMGHLHLISEAISEIETIFSRLGFVRRRYPEIESDWYYAEGLNIPKNHPARDDQETFYLSPSVVLTAHTSNGQLREMELIKNPPIKMINIGKTYRRQASNTHSPMFHQFEGLVVDKNINITHLIGVSNFFAREYFGHDRQIRLRPHHFQFTEPSFEVDINCHLCKGKGVIGNEKCKVCKSGWLELGGAGMVHPQVLKNGGLDPKIYSGFAFGWGVERVIMMKHRISDNLRDLYSDDLRFLNQS